MYIILRTCVSFSYDIYIIIKNVCLKLFMFCFIGIYIYTSTCVMATDITSAR